MGRQSPEPLVRRFTHRNEQQQNETAIASQQSKTSATPSKPESRAIEALKQLFCGGAAGSVAKTVTAPLSRLTILYQVHPMVTTKEHRPKFSMTIRGGISKIVERGGVLSLWKGNGTSVLHRFPFSAINFYVYEGVMDLLNGPQRLSDDDEDDITNDKEVSTFSRLFAGAAAGTTACVACYPLDLVRTRLTTQLENKESYRGISDAFVKIVRNEGFVGLYAGLAPTLMVAVPNFSISWMVYGSLKEYALEDELFYNLRKVDAGTGEEKLGFLLTLMCGAASGTLSTWVTFPFDTVRRRMQIQGQHFAPEERISASQMIRTLLKKDGIKGFYRGIAPEVMKVIPMVGTMFTVYEYLKDQLLPSN
uniref:Mitochondrial carrier protein n=2 Tax=Skeletonema marinoi TaxID=267567 RepID=A0A7S2KTF8_9STRA|mmetsp:Transcript_37057/g.75569  ORF Transcript_37057/g.75569 Transcript_37057/m.75569 type:complete len:363 (-) Transcript_37057:2751-3839(-)|eukprot:scaffold22009_cov133-Skeletonema_marinoi.AAC.2